MINLNKKFEYWIENFGDVNRLCFGCYYPDDVDDKDYDLIDSKKAEYLKSSFNLAEFKKIIVFSETLFGNSKTPLGVYISKDNLPNNNMQSLLEDEYFDGKDKTKIHIVEINSNTPEKIVKYGCFMVLIHSTEFNNDIHMRIFNECKKANYKYFTMNSFHEMFKKLNNSIKGSHVFVNNCGTTDVRIFRKLPKFVGTIYTYSVYGDLVNKVIPEEYCQPMLF